MRSDAAIDGEGQRDEGIAEEKAFDLRERQHAFYRAVPLGVEKMRAMPENAGNDVLPASAVEKSRFRAGEDEVVPAFRAL